MLKVLKDWRIKTVLFWNGVEGQFLNAILESTTYDSVKMSYIFVEGLLCFGTLGLSQARLLCINI